MNNKDHFILFRFFFLWIGVGLFFFGIKTWAAPQVRIKTGFSDLKVTATGNQIDQQPLNSAVTFQPTVLWDVPSFSSRVGVNYLQEIGSPYGNTTISGIGVSAYYYLFGISTLNFTDEQGSVIQKSRPGPFIFTSITPVNFNLNQFDEGNTSNNFFASSYIYDISTGIGYDYPITRNLVLAVEYTLRNGTSGESKTGAGTMSYRGSTIYLSFATTYF